MFAEVWLSNLPIWSPSVSSPADSITVTLSCMALQRQISADSSVSRAITAGVFIDLAKAFDTIDHSILLKKLSHYGIRGVVLDYFCTYLRNRKQYVSLNGNNSKLLDVRCGVPQGSILGPLLFLLYINDLNSVSVKLKTIMFADDTNLFTTGNTIDEVESCLNNELRLVNLWFQANVVVVVVVV